MPDPDNTIHIINKWVRLADVYPCDMSNPPGTCINKKIKTGHKVRYLKSWVVVEDPDTGVAAPRVLAQNHLCKFCWQKHKALILKHHKLAAKQILQQEHMADLFDKTVEATPTGKTMPVKKESSE